MSKAVGIHLGEHYSVVAAIDDDVPVVVPDAYGNHATPSVVTFKNDGEALVGIPAANLGAWEPDRTASPVRDHLGESWTLDVDGERHRPEELVARVLWKLKHDVERHIDGIVTQAVIAVPTHFDDAQRRAVVEAGQLADIGVLQLIDEPVAATLAYGLENSRDTDTVLVLDLSRCTLTASVLEIARDSIAVKSSCRDSELGGDDWIKALRDVLTQMFLREYGVDIAKSPVDNFLLLEAAQEAKWSLCEGRSARVTVPLTQRTTTSPAMLNYEVTSGQFEQLTSDLLDRCRTLAKEAIDASGVAAESINQVVLAGGSARMPAVSKLARELAGTRPRSDVDLGGIVALGAALRAQALSRASWMSVEVAGASQAARRLIDQVQALVQEASQTLAVEDLETLIHAATRVETALNQDNFDKIGRATAALSAALEELSPLPHEPVPSASQLAQG